MSFHRSVSGPILGTLLLAAFALGQQPSDKAAFTNPVLPHGADPWVVRHGDHYYLCQSQGGSIWVARFDRLPDIARAKWSRVWTPPKGKPYSEELWAPELHHLRGRWYIYVAADAGKNEDHRMYVLEGDATDPTKPFAFKSRLTADPDRWAIDGTVVAFPDDRLYFVWSGWEGTENVAQDLYIARMKDPWTLDGPRVRISRPDQEWEQRGGPPTINEGPEALWHDGRLCLLYSASGSWTDDYCLGRLDFKAGADPLDPAAWSKHPAPVFSKTAKVFGPGHASFTTGPDGKTSWIVYHSARHAGAGWDRHVNMQPFTWNDDGSPNLGAPLDPGTPLPTAP